MAQKIVKVVVPVTDIWAKPDFESSRISQAVFGEKAEVLKRKQKYLYVRCEDGYRGWLNGAHVIGLRTDRPLHAQSIVRVPVAEVYSTPKAKTVSGRLSFGSRIEYDQKLSGMLRLIDADGWIKESDLRLKKPPHISARAIITALKMFLGIPYLWGGKSGFGLDCSGLVQIVYGFYGYDLPRDSKDQRNKGRRVTRRNLKPGDLIFSPGHVAVYIGKGSIIHASLKAGGVKIESIDSRSELYREDIDKKIIEMRRVI
ncbi:MAG: C40 family peptidase [candidate division Zixibacteria bacterium]|nr:C40 family peptidase [candidate division Zixibacteria bacterium]NIR63077.1 C40 family peptidase [candidate division Zixibacteria bacterium]NIS17370.1 C40 family peptidase [candidate division Zixibacteria bacterium]NIS45337.1 C40 family peptidase [candidate division Zixibacteria bacterium]NIT53709.1 C40 family peptidase [candidate division Zixibacteria bacterium]